MRATDDDSSCTILNIILYQCHSNKVDLLSVGIILYAFCCLCKILVYVYQGVVTDLTLTRLRQVLVVDVRGVYLIFQKNINGLCSSLEHNVYNCICLK